MTISTALGPERKRPCWTCQHFAGSQVGGRAANCARGSVTGTPKSGCAFWQASEKQPMRLLVCGGRDYCDDDYVFESLDKVLSKRRVVLVIHGGAAGADTLADDWAKARGIEVMAFPVFPDEWKTVGSKAGPLRNTRMLRDGKPDGVVAFPGGRGTADMVRQAKSAGVPVWVRGLS